MTINGNEKTACFLFKQAVIVRCNTKSFAKYVFVAKIQRFRLKFYAMRDFWVFFAVFWFSGCPNYNGLVLNGSTSLINLSTFFIVVLAVLVSQSISSSL